MSAVKWEEGVRGVSSMSPVATRVKQDCVSAPLLCCMGRVLGRFVGQSHCGASVGSAGVTDLVSVDGAAVLVESLKAWVRAVDTLHEEASKAGISSLSG